MKICIILPTEDVEMESGNCDQFCGWFLGKMEGGDIENHRHKHTNPKNKPGDKVSHR